MDYCDRTRIELTALENEMHFKVHLVQKSAFSQNVKMQLVPGLLEHNCKKCPSLRYPMISAVHIILCRSVNKYKVNCTL
jgi:hypothetical protein